MRGVVIAEKRYRRGLEAFNKAIEIKPEG